jgi:uncharacterized cupin superfamily protein
MERVDPDAVESTVPDTGTRRSPLSELLGTTDVAVNRYRIPPGEGLPAGLHAHLDQEEVFLVLRGTATFEVLLPDREARVVTLEAGEAVRFAPGEFQSGRNDGEDELEMLALGAPADSEAIRLPATCPACGHPELGLEFEGEGLSFACPDCGETRVPAACPDCGHHDLRIELADDGGTETVCHGCGSTYPEPVYES